jgi:hypothetical protein
MWTLVRSLPNPLPHDRDSAFALVPGCVSTQNESKPRFGGELTKLWVVTFFDSEDLFSESIPLSSVFRFPDVEILK